MKFVAHGPLLATKESALRPIYCKACTPERLQGALINVVNDFCEVEGCGTRPSFGKPGDTVATRCKKHIAEGMTDVRTPICEDCKQRIRRGGFKMKGDKRVR
eukprot:20172-Heterococcus_DN1.PRE.1